MALPGLEKLGVENLREAQENDYWFGSMIKYIINNELPSTRKLCQRILASYQDYIVINNILYHLWTSGNTTPDTVQPICITNTLNN